MFPRLLPYMKVTKAKVSQLILKLIAGVTSPVIQGQKCIRRPIKIFSILNLRPHWFYVPNKASFIYHSVYLPETSSPATSLQCISDCKLFGTGNILFLSYMFTPPRTMGPGSHLGPTAIQIINMHHHPHPANPNVLNRKQCCSTSFLTTKTTNYSPASPLM